MFARFVPLRVKEETAPEFHRFYADQVIPAFEKTEGCLLAMLLRHSVHADEYQSLTLWRTPEDAGAYESSGLYHALLERTRPYLSDRTEWRVRLVDDTERTLALNQLEIPPEAYRVDAVADEGMMKGRLRSLYLRVAALRVKPDRVQEFKRVYTTRVIPELREVAGFRGVFLVEGAREPHDFLAVTLWQRQEDAVRYELSGPYEQLVAAIDDTLEQAPQVDFSSGAEGEGEAGQPALDITGYDIVVAKRL